MPYPMPPPGYPAGPWGQAAPGYYYPPAPYYGYPY
jgi:hypothetical protein